MKEAMRRNILPLGFGLVIVVLAATGLYLTACDSSGGTPAANVLLIVVDTLRADRLGCMGNTLGMTPNMDAVAAEGVLFENAFSHAPWTLPSIASLFTSTYPAQHGAGGRIPRQLSRLREEARTVGQCFQNSGARTVCVANVDFLTETYGMTKGFDSIDFVKSTGNRLTRRAEETTDAALKWLKDLKSGPFFLMVHYFDPHLAYEPPAEFRRAFALEQDRESEKVPFSNVLEIVAYRQGKFELSDERINRLEALYNGEVAYTDQEIGRLLAGLEQEGLSRSTVVVVTSDHGEEFNDHGSFEHGHTHYDELLHVPLIIRKPGLLPAGKEVGPVVRHIDLAPTLCRLANIEPGDWFEGRDLSPFWNSGAKAEDLPVFCQGHFWGPPRYSRRANGYKIIVHEQDKSLEVYDLTSDPAEKNDLALRKPDLANRLKSDLLLILKGMLAEAGAVEMVDLSPEDVNRLRALGYGY